ILLSPAVLDQQQTSSSGSASIVGGVGTTTTWQGQTFVPAVTGRLQKIDVGLFCSGCSGTTPPITVEIRTASGNLPTPTVLATATIPGFFSGIPFFYTAVFATPASLTAGSPYAYTLHVNTAPSAGTYAALFSSASSAYPGGNRVQSTNGGVAWGITGSGTPPTARDLLFRTYMQSTFVTPGTFSSSVKDANPAAGFAPVWSSLSFNTTLPGTTAVTFQGAGSNDPNGPFTFVGPDGTAGTFFNSGDPLTPFNGFRYLKYQAQLSTRTN